MTDISRLKVSLTKHNAHKIARLLKDYPVNEILLRLDEVHAESAQAKKNLSVRRGDKIPEVWAKAKALGESAIDALVLVGIIFSHHELIYAMRTASDRRGFSGRIDRGIQLNNKAYTNFVRVVDQLGYATKLNYPGVTFDLRSMFQVPGLGPIVGELLRFKLVDAKWAGKGSFVEEAIANKFHDVFGIPGKQFRDWLSDDAQPEGAEVTLLPKDAEFFQTESEGKQSKAFEFRAGHTKREVEAFTRSSSNKTKVNQLHNDIQNRLFAYLEGIFGEGHVGTEIDTGDGTSIDMATLIESRATFYEIKTSSSVRACIRQAIPQLLEYAYWPEAERAQEIVIVSHLPVTNEADCYLNFLRIKFNLPISYKQFNLATNSLI